MCIRDRCWGVFGVLLRKWRLRPLDAMAGLATVSALLYLPVYFLWLPTSMSTAPTAQTYEIMPVQKAPGNPYPDRISVGRARNCDVVLRDPSVSKLHAHFRRRDDEKLELVDLGSQNGTRINSRLLVPHQPESVSASDQLVFGGVNAKLVDADQLYELLTAK